MARSRSKKTTLAFCKDQINEIATMLDNYVSIGEFYFDFNHKATQLTDDIQIINFLNRLNAGSIINNIINSRYIGHNYKISLINLNMSARQWRDSSSILFLTKEEKEALETVLKLTLKITTSLPRFSWKKEIDEVLNSGKVEISNLYTSESPQGQRYRYMCDEWANRFSQDFEFLKLVYNGRKKITRSRRVTYKILEDVAEQMLNNEVPKLDAYQEFRAVKTQVDNALTRITRILIDQEPLQSQTQDLDIFISKTSSLNEDLVNPLNLD